nr:AIR synthase family protein [Candidatus Freyarchaeota archaeon]
MHDTSLPKIGKISPEIFDEIIYPHLGSKNKKVIVGPRHGVDFGVVDLGKQVMILTTDPVFIVPEYGWERSAWFAVHILASDEAVSGIKPAYLSIDLNLPMEMTKEELKKVWTIMHEECVKLGITVVCGHTGRYTGCNYPMVGGGTVIGIGPKDSYVTSEMAKPGDKVIVTKGPAIETTGIFATLFPEILEEKFGKEFAERAKDVFWMQSVVKDALVAVGVGVRERGVTAMHDATECGVWGGLYEISQASKAGMVINQDDIILLEEVRLVCEYFSKLTGVNVDPFKAISEGTLLLTAKPEKAEKVVAALNSENIPSSIVGAVVPQEEGITVVKGDGEEMKLTHPKEDPFWPAFYKTLEIIEERSKQSKPVSKGGL